MDFSPLFSRRMVSFGIELVGLSEVALPGSRYVCDLPMFLRSGSVTPKPLSDIDPALCSPQCLQPDKIVCIYLSASVLPLPPSLEHVLRESMDFLRIPRHVPS